MVESAAAEADDELMNKYLETGISDEADIKAGIRRAVIASEIVPMFCGSPFKTRACKRC